MNCEGDHYSAGHERQVPRQREGSGLPRATHLRSESPQSGSDQGQKPEIRSVNFISKFIILSTRSSHISQEKLTK